MDATIQKDKKNSENTIKVPNVINNHDYEAVVKDLFKNTEIDDLSG